MYLQTEGYQALEKALKQMTPDQIIDEVKKSNLRGRGGAGFPAGMKWSFVPKETGGKPKYILANGDESEPGTCKDRPLLEMDPHQLIEGMVIAGKAVDAHRGFIYIRGEYRYVLDIMDAAISEAYAKGYLGQKYSRQRLRFRPDHAHRRGRLRMRRRIGADGISGRQARLSAHPAALPCGGRLVWLPDGDQQRGNAEHRAGDHPRRRRMVRRPRHAQKWRHAPLFHLRTHQSPGNLRIAAGFPLRRLIEEVAGGMRDGKKLKAVIPGGSSCPLLTADEIDVAMDYDSVAKIGSMLGSGGTVIFDEDTCMVDLARRIMHFYAHESCGWCIPCREGTAWLRKMLDRFHEGGGTAEDIPLIGELSQEHAGPHFLPAGRRRSSAHDQHREKMAQRI